MTEEIDPARWRELNRAWWDERVPLHVASDLYDVEGFAAGAEQLRPFELDLAGDVEGLRLVHLQCHFGQDSIAWARHGASVVGLDFSEPAVSVANDLAGRLGADARFVCADVYDALDALDGEQFDLVYTGLGALNWLPDLTRWAAVVRSLVRPGGRLLLAEFHPFSWVFEEDLSIAYRYFTDAPLTMDDIGTYADLSAITQANATVEHQHTVADVLTALLGTGFALRAFEEFDYTLFPQFDALEQRDGRFRFPDGGPSLPLMYALLADVPTRPEAP